MSVLQRYTHHVARRRDLAYEYSVGLFPVSAGTDSGSPDSGSIAVGPSARAARQFASLGLQGARVLFVANSGGHLAEMCRIAPLLGAASTSACVSFDTDQAREITWVDDVRFVPYVGPRDLANTARAARRISNILLDGPWDAVVSTGAAVAVSALPLAAAVGIRAIYIESYARFRGPSTTGRILSRLPGRYELYTQHESWAGTEWTYGGSVVDTVRRGHGRTPGDRPTTFVTLGTIKPYRFDSLVDSVLAHAPRDTDFVWQLGATTRSDLPGRAYDYLPRAQFSQIARQASTVVGHAGVGTAIELIEMGHRPILVPRRAGRREHVDDHQVQIAADLARRDLVVACESEDLGAHTFDHAAAVR